MALQVTTESGSIHVTEATLTAGGEEKEEEEEEEECYGSRKQTLLEDRGTEVQSPVQRVHRQTGDPHHQSPRGEGPVRIL